MKKFTAGSGFCIIGHELYPFCLFRCTGMISGHSNKRSRYGTNDSGQRLAGGIYYLRFDTHEAYQTRPGPAHTILLHQRIFLREVSGLD